MTEIETDRILFTLLILIIGFIGGLVVGHGKDER